jgi:hypothetical protein
LREDVLDFVRFERFHEFHHEGQEKMVSGTAEKRTTETKTETFNTQWVQFPKLRQELDPDANCIVNSISTNLCKFVVMCISSKTQNAFTKIFVGFWIRLIAKITIIFGKMLVQ